MRDLARIPGESATLECARTFHYHQDSKAWTKTYYVITVGRKKKKGYIHQAIESESNVISHNTRAALQGDSIIIL